MPKSWALDAASPVSVGMAVCVALGLAACGGGGGGSNVKPTPPPPVDTSPMVVNTDLSVASGQTITRPIVLDSGADLDNQGALGGNVDIGVEAKASSIVTNHGGGTIRGTKTAIRLDHGGEIHNDAGSTIQGTGTGGTDCGANVKCAIFVGSRGDGSSSAPLNPELVNEGTIIGNVKLWSDDAHWVKLYTGSTIQGDLDLGGKQASILSISGEAGTTQRYSQAVTGSTILAGELQKGGAGTWMIDKDLQVGWVAIDGGTLQIGDGGTSGSLVGAPTIFFAGGNVVFDRSDDVVSGVSFYDTYLPGSLLKAGSGTLTLTSDRIVTASVVIEGGTLRLTTAGASSSLPSLRAGAIANNGALVFDGDLPLSTYAGISGSGALVKDGTGSLALFTPSTYTGVTRIDRGTLLPVSLAGDVVVGTDGSLGGRFGHFEGNNGMGDIAGSVANHGRTVVAGGDAHVGGDYAQSASGTLSVELGGKLVVDGGASLAGTLEVNGASPSFIPTAHTELLTAAGGVSGTFDQLVKAPGVVFVSNTINYDANSVWLDTTGLDITVAAAGGGIGYTPASMAAAERVQGAFEQLNARISTNALAGVSGDFLLAAGRFQRAPTIEAAQASLRSLSGQLHAASAAMTFRAIDAGNQALSDRLDGISGGHADVGMWTQQLDGNGSMGRSSFDGIGYRFNGWLVGNDYRVGRNGVAGFAFGQGSGTQQLQRGIDRDDSRRTEGMVYAGLSDGRWYAQGRIAFGHVRQEIDRQLLLGSTFDGVSTRYDGRYEAAYGESGMRFALAGLRLAPFLSVGYARSERDAFSEAGAGGFGLRSSALGLQRWQASLGLRATRRWDFGHGRTLDFGAHAQWRRGLRADSDIVDASFVGLEQWSPLAGIGLSRHGSVLGFGMDAQLSPRAALKLSYDYERGQYDSARGVTAGLNVAF